MAAVVVEKFEKDLAPLSTPKMKPPFSQFCKIVFREKYTYITKIAAPTFLSTFWGIFSGRGQFLGDG